MRINFQSNKESKEVVTLTIQGEVDTDTSPQVREHLSDLFKNNPKAIIVDLSRVTYINSLGLAILVEGLQWSHNNNSKFMLTGLTPMIKDVFAIAHLLNVFNIYDSKEDALNGI